MVAKLNVKRTKQLLEEFDFRRLFVEELGWQNPASKAPLKFASGGLEGEATPIAELGGVSALLIESREVPDAKARKAIHDKLKTQRAEHILVFVDPEHARACWSWVKVENKKPHIRDHFYFKGQPGDGFIAKIANMAVDLSELDDQGQLGLVEASKKVQNALDVQRVVKRFYTGYKDLKDEFVLAIRGIDDPADRAWYASVVLNRLKFIYFLQKAGYLDGGNIRYLEDKLAKHGETFYAELLPALFFQAFALPPDARTAEAKQLTGDIPYLNGGLFLPHRLEQRYEGQIDIPAEAFAGILKHFGEFSWTFDDVPGNPDNDINPDVLGYIFEKYINQKEFGAYYTPTEITDYLCQQTVERLVLDKMADQGYKHHDTVGDLLMRLDGKGLEFLLRNVLPNISLLDPACGSGAFLFAALKSMMDMYTAAMGRIDAVSHDGLQQWRERTFAGHRSVGYRLKKMIITDNLYGVDIMEEAVEIAKLRLFMALISSVHHKGDIEPLPNIDFNILPGNSLIGLMRVESEAFDKKRKSQGSLFGTEHGYEEIIRKKTTLTARFRHPEDGDPIQKIRDEIDKLDKQAKPTLLEMLLEKFREQKVSFEQAKWDAKAGKEGRTEKRAVTLEDLASLEPFHWVYEFSTRFKDDSSGFDAIITNPPWEILKPQDKEFFLKVSSAVSKNNMTIKEFEDRKIDLLRNDPNLRESYECYLSAFPYQSAFFRTAPEYANQSAIVNGKRTGTDVNLYKLFTERCFDLLRPGGLCGMVIPGSIYTDMGSTGLRRLLFQQSEVGAVIGLSNEKFIFDGVHHAYKICLLSYRKGASTAEFNAAFRIDPREAIAKTALGGFLQSRSNLMRLSIDLITETAPETCSVMEFKSSLDIQIAQKMLRFPLVSELIPGSWQLKLNAEFHMTNDSHRFHTKPAAGLLPLFEGKMMNQFTSTSAEARYWLDESSVQQSAFKGYRCAFRAVAGSSNLRTMTATILPPNCGAGNSLVVNHARRSGESDDAANELLACAILNSFPFDYRLRQAVTTNINMHFVYATRAPKPVHSDPIFPCIVSRVARLICQTPEFADLWNEVMQDTLVLAAAQKATFQAKTGKPLTPVWTPDCGATTPADRARLRAELDGLVAHLYELTEEEFAHILSTFPLVKQDDKDAAMAEYRKIAGAKRTLGPQVH